MQGSPCFEQIGTSVGRGGSWTQWQLDSMILMGPCQLEMFYGSMITSLFYHCAFVCDPFYKVVEYLFFRSVAHVLGGGEYNS